LVVLVNKEEEE